MNRPKTERFRLPRYKRYAAFIAAIGLLREPCGATALVVVISKHTITFAADSKTVIVHPNQTIPNGSGITRKIRRTAGGIVWGAAGTERIGTDRIIGYDFGAFSDSVEKKIALNSSVSEVAQLIRSELVKTFEGFDVLIVKGAISPKDVSPGGFERFFIGGYENGAPKVFRIDMDIDWAAKHLVGPSIVNVYPGECQRTSLSMCGAGPEAIKDLKTPTSAYSKWALCRAPTEIRALGMDQDISADQSVLLARTIVDLGINAEPKRVGLPVVVVSLTPDGGHTEYIYATRLPNQCATRQAKK
jgi:hypothetical protein